MDYRYIRQLLERYWKCETTLEEEKILRTFFGQKDVPADLLPYRDLFAYEAEEVKADVLGDDFDEKILSLIGEEEKPRIKAIRISMRERFMPLFKAAAVVAIIVALGGAAQFQFGHHDTDDDINYADYKDTYNDPSVAYDKVENALEMISEGFSQTQQTDSVVVIGDAAKGNTNKAE